jgi:hypothetical protein
MDGFRLRDRVSRAMGQAARFNGVPYTVFRPRGMLPPLEQRLGTIAIYASFTPQPSQGGLASRIGDALWHGQFDTCYTCAGDYLVGDGNIFFIVNQVPLFTPVCIKTNARITVYAAAADGPSQYAGFQIETAFEVARNWPAYEALQGGDASSNTTATRFGIFEFILPVSFPDIDAGLVVVDGSGRCYLVDSIAHGAFGKLLRATVFTA